MSTPNQVTEYILLFQGPEWDEELSPEQLQQAMDRVMGWFDGLQQQGKVKGGQPLGRERRIVSANGTRIIADGPFAESKEAVGGYLVLEVNSMDEAVNIAQSCPSLQHGTTIEVRPVLDECPTFQRVKERLAQATV